MKILIGSWLLFRGLPPESAVSHAFADSEPRPESSHQREVNDGLR